MRTSDQYWKRVRLPTLHTWCADIPAPILQVISAWNISSICSLLFHFCFLVSITSRVTDSEILDRSVPCEPTCGNSAHVQIRLYTIQIIFCLLSVCMHWHFAKVRLIPDECGWSRRSCLHAAAFCKLGLFEDHLQNETLENVQQTPILSW